MLCDERLKYDLVSIGLGVFFGENDSLMWFNYNLRLLRWVGILFWSLVVCFGLGGEFFFLVRKIVLIGDLIGFGLIRFFFWCCWWWGFIVWCNLFCNFDNEMNVLLFNVCVGCSLNCVSFLFGKILINCRFCNVISLVFFLLSVLLLWIFWGLGICRVSEILWFLFIVFGLMLRLCVSWVLMMILFLLGECVGWGLFLVSC